MNFDASGDTLKLANSAFSLSSMLQLLPQQLQRVFYSVSGPSQALEIFIRHHKDITGVGCSLPQLLSNGIHSALTRTTTPDVFACILSLPADFQVNLHTFNQRDHRGELIDYIMFKQGSVWSLYQQVPLRLTPRPSLQSIQPTKLMQSDCSQSLRVTGKRVHGDYRIKVGEEELRWKAEGKEESKVLGPDCVQIERLLKTGRRKHNISAWYQNPISGESTVIANIQGGLEIEQHQRLGPVFPFIETSKESVNVTFASANSLPGSPYQDDIFCTHLLNDRRTFSRPHLIMNNTQVLCRINVKKTFKQQNVTVGIQYRDGTILSSEPVIVSIKPMFLGNFTISPQVTLCNSKQKQTIALNFAESHPMNLLEQLTLSNDTALMPKSETMATASLYLPCKRNITYYKFNLYSTEGDPLSVGRANVLSINPFQIRDIHQKNDKVYFEVDREIEFELLSKSFTIQCMLGNSTISRVEVNEFHQFFCSYQNVKVDSRQLQLKLNLVREDENILEVAQSFQLSNIISVQSVRAMLAKNTIMSEIEESFEVEVFTDPTTLAAIARTQIACRLKSMQECRECQNDLYFEGLLDGTTIRCYKGLLELANISPLKVSLVLGDIEVDLQGNDKLSSQFVHIYDIKPSTHFFVGTFSNLSLRLSHDLSGYQLNCILVPKFSQEAATKYIFTAVRNKTHITCPIVKQDLKEGPHWVTIGMRDSPYHLDLGKTSIQVYSRLNFTGNEPRYILTRSTEVTIEIYGHFAGLMSYYARHKQLDMIKVNFTGVERPRNKMAYFDIYTLTNNRMTVKIPDFKQLIHWQQPFTSSIGVYDLENEIHLGEIEDAFTIIDPINIADVRPRAQFSPIDYVNVTFKLSDAANITHCIQVIDEQGSEIVTPTLMVSKYEHQCLTYLETLNVSLGVKGDNSQVITRLSDIHIMNKKGPVMFHKIEPINGPKAGGTIVNVTGQNLLSTVPFNQALLCRFGSVKVTASLVSSETIQCKAPQFSKAGPVEFSLEIQEPREYFMASKVIRFFYEDDIEIKQVVPSFIDLSESMVWLEVVTREPVMTRSPKSIFCKLEKDIPNNQQVPSQATVIAIGQHKSNDDHTIVCPIPTYSLSHLLRYKLSVSGNSGANYSSSFFQLRVFPILEIPGLMPPLFIQGRKQRQIIPMSHVDTLSGKFQCLFTSSTGQTYSFLGLRYNSTAVSCDIYPIDTSFEVAGSLRIQDAEFNLTTRNSIGLRIIRDKILIKNVVPSAHVHLIPSTVLTFQAYLTEGVAPRDVEKGLCTFSNDINKDWISVPIRYVNDRLLNCSLPIPAVISKQIQEVYPYLFLQIQSNGDAELFSDTSYPIGISKRPVIMQTVPDNLNRALENHGEIGVVGENFNVTSECSLHFSLVDGVHQYYGLHSECVNQSYILCNLTSNQALRPYLMKREMILAVSNNRGLQYSEGYSLKFIDETDLSAAQKTISYGNLYPVFGPYQGGLTLTLEVLDYNLAAEDWENLYCEFDTVERTEFKLVNKTHGRCLQAPSKYIQAVRLRLISTDVRVTAFTNFDHYFEYIADFEFLSMEPEFHLLGAEDTSKEVTLIGRNFNLSHSYVAVLRNETAHQTYTYELPAKQISDRELVIDVAQIKGQFNLRLKVELQILRNDPQLTKHYPRHFYLIRSPEIRLSPPDQFIRRNFLEDHRNVISLDGDNIFVDDIAIACVYQLVGWSTSTYEYVQPLWQSTVRYGNGTRSKIWCKVPLPTIINGGVKPEVYLSLMYRDLDHQTNQVRIPVIYEAQVSHFHPEEIELGKLNTIYIIGTGFGKDHPYLCNFTSANIPFASFEIAIPVNETHLACTASPVQDQADATLHLEVIDQFTNEVIGRTKLMFKEDTTIKLRELVPRAVYHNISDAYLDVYGSQFLSDCQCMFGNVTSAVTTFIDGTHLKCLVPSSYIKDRESINRTIKGFSTRFSLSCPHSRRISTNHLSLFIKYGTEIRKLSRSYVRENQFEGDRSITLRGRLFYPGQTCTLRNASGFVIESPVKQFIDEETVVCETQGDFFVAERDNPIYLSIKEYDAQNHSIVYESNRMRVWYLPQFIIWPGFNNETEIFYLQEDDQVVPLETNIRRHSNFTYHCLYGQDNKYISSPVFDDESKRLVGCHLPFILEEMSGISLKLQEVASDAKVSFSNSISFRLQMPPAIEWVDPKVIPAYDHGTWIIQLKGRFFIGGQTRIFFDELMYADLTVQSDALGTFVAPKNIPPGFLKLKITNNLLKNPHIMRNEKTLEYMILPAIHSMLPSEVPTRDVPQKVIVQGANFSSQSQCMFDGKLAVTTYLTSSLLECDAPVIFAGQEVLVQVLERNLYLNRETHINLKYYASPFVYKVEPRYAFRTHEGTEVKVYVSNLHQITTQEMEFQFCKFGIYSVQVSDIHFIEDLKAKTNYTVFICRTPYHPGKEVVQVEILTDSGIFSSSINNHFEFLDPPTIKHASPPIAPYGVKDIEFILEGGPFDPAYEYYCQYRELLTYLNETKAFYVTNEAIRCVIPGENVIRHSEYVTIRIMMKDLRQTYSYMLPGTARVLFYDPLHITKIEPTSGDVAGGTEIYIEGYNFDVSYGGIKCKFGNNIVQAQPIENYKLIKCIAPPSRWSYTNDAAVSISVDEVNYFSGEFGREVFFEYRVPPTFDDPIPMRQSVWGERPLLITGHNFPNKDRSLVICRFTFTSSSARIDIRGSFVTDLSITCTMPRHLLVDDLIILQVSFNNLDFYEVTSIENTLTYSEKARIRSIYPTFGFANANIFGTELKIEGDYFEEMEEALFGNFTRGIALTSRTDSWLNVSVPSYVNISILDNTTHYGDNRAKVEFQNQIVGRTSQQLTYTYINYFKIIDASPSLVNEAGDILYLEGEGFINTPALNCRFGELFASSVRYFNRTKIACGTPFIEDKTRRYQVGVTFNGIEYLYFKRLGTNENFSIQFLSNLRVVQIVPDLAFANELNQAVILRVEGLLDLDTVSCKIHDYITRGRYFEMDGFTWIQCVIPSLDFIIATSGNVPIQADASFIIEVSNNGKDFSVSRKRFKYIVIEQLQGIYPTTGPEKGGTVIDITVADLPNIGGNSGDFVDIAKCFFPGYPPQKAKWISLINVQCTTPRLIENIDNVTSTQSFAVAEVWIEIIGEMNAKFAFVYTKDLHITALDPYNAYIASSQLALSTPILVRGSNFLPVQDLIQCKYHFEEPLVLRTQVNIPSGQAQNDIDSGQIIVIGTYINNHTIECRVPSLKIDPPMFNEIRMKVEISLNRGIQFTSDGLLFTYRHKDKMTYMYPQRGFTFGNTYLTLGYEYLYDKSSIRQVCQFTNVANPSESFSTRIISFDEHFVYCYTPPAYLVSQTLAQSGGEVQVRISSNNRDFSDADYKFRYDPVARIDQVSPLWVIKDQRILMSLHGEFFIQTNLLQIKLASSDGARVAYVSQNMTELIYRTTSLIQFYMPSDVFIEKDFVMIYLKFGEDFWYLAEQRVFIYSQVSLDRLKPNYAYTHSGGVQREIFVYGRNYWDTQKSGHLRCLLDDTTYVPAQYVNETLVLCSVASRTTPGTVKIDVFISPEIKSISSLSMQFIDEPVIDRVNISSYYFNYQHRVPVRVTGINFATNLHIDGKRRIYVRVDDSKFTRPIDAGANFFDFYMPLGLNTGTYRISVSTDGLFYRPREQEETQFTITVLPCPPGKYCYHFSVHDCRPGYYCPQNHTFMEIKCPAGLFQPSSSQQTCQRCPSGTFCKEQQLTEPKACPRGYLCEKGITISHNMMTICPDGYVCPKNTTSIDIYDVNNTLNGIQTCPDGYWCAEGSFSLIPDYGLFNSPQICRDEVVCKNELNTTNNRSTYYPGPLDQYGNKPCPRGHFCKDGIATVCPAGTFCHEEQLRAPIPCQYGQFNMKTGQTQCTLCPVGTYCMQAGTVNPTRCRPGYTCQFEGAPYPAQVCPAGSYCASMTVTNSSFSTIQQAHKPNLCSAATYCLKGASSPIVDAGNAQSAQKCQAGTYCREGTKDPNGEGKCWPGYYCPSNSPEPLPAEPGFFSQGYGNEKQEPCRAGTFQDDGGTVECRYCLKGSECPDQQMRWHQICKAGRYSQFISQTECTKCPAGTYSNEIGIDNINKCKDCLPKYYCPEPGINSMQKAIQCQEGQYCVLRTTAEVMFTSNCWPGYYSDFRSSGLEDFYLCDPGFYCTSGTSKTKYKQNNCLQDFYCPRGTAAEISMDTGKFIESKVFQVQKEEIIKSIEGLIRTTRQVVNAFDQRGLNRNYDALTKQYNLLQGEYQNRSRAGELEKNLTDLLQDIGARWKELDDMWWLNSTYNYNVTYLLKREDYLNELKNEKECVENKILPIELRVAYFQRGKNLKCPNGTTSNRGSQCLGQCYRKQSSNIAISIMDPVNKTLKINSADESDYDEQTEKTVLNPTVDPTRQLRILQSLQQVNRTLQTVQNAFYVNDEDWIDVIDTEILPEDFKSTYDYLRTYVLKPLEIAKVLLDFRSLPRNFFYNEHFAVVILDKENKIIDLPFYFDPDNNDRTNKKANLEIRVFNWREYDIEFKVSIYLFHGLFQPYLRLLRNKVNVVFYNANRQKMYQNVTWAMFVSKSITEGITLPYNMPDWGKEPEFYVDMTARGSDINPVRRPIDKDVYDSTYWDAQLITANIMPWLPYFSNCEGQDQRVVLYDILEYHEKCILPRYKDIKVVNPIPSTGLDPIADECKVILKCIYDEPVFQPIASSTRWYAIREPKDLFFITREPVGIDRIREIDPFSESGQTAYANLINDGSDELLTVTFYPDISAPGFPGVVELNINFYQESKDIKRIAEVNVFYRNYTDYNKEDSTVVPSYQLQLNYQALSYFDLINTFQFSIPIYIVLFVLVSMIQILLIIIFWLFTFIFCPCLLNFKRSPSLRFSHMARVLFKQPAVGTIMANVPAMICAGLLKVLQDNTWFDRITSDWSNWGLQIDPAEQVIWKRGRLGLAMIIISSVFMFYGSDTMVHKPTDLDQAEIVKEMKAYKKRSVMEMSFDDSDADNKEVDDVELREHDENISEALAWKRRHLFINSFFIAIFFMLKIEFSYTDTFGQNIIMFQIFFAILDIFIDQLVTRVIMGEALMTTPVTAVFTALEFVMTMGADDFQSFILSYFAEVGIALMMRTYIGPIVEKIELKVQQTVIRLSQRFKLVENIFRGILQRQLNMQLQLINLAEYHDDRKDERTGYTNILEKGEGMEALLGSISTYASNTQAMILVPFILAHIIFFANETKIPQGYAIAQRELPYYLTFSCIIIFPQMVIDIFLLHLLEVIWGYKVYDYFTYAEYKFRNRQKKWMNQESFSRSIIHSWRSLDNMSFSQQFYYVSSLMTWGIIYLVLGMTILVRNQYNPFADPVITIFIIMVSVSTSIIRYFIREVSDYFKIWEVTHHHFSRVDVSQINKLDKEYSMRVLVRNLQTNPFRHKFLRVNREWLIHNIATILGGKNYLKHAGPELNFLQKIYQRAVNAHEIDKKLQVHFDHIQDDLAVMPYNKPKDEGDNVADQISDDSISDLPVYNWQIPFQITYEHIQIVAKQWVDYAKHNMRLKEMVSDIIAKKLRPKCQRCKSVFRLQVIQKIQFNEIIKRYRLYTQGFPFTRARWRRFYTKNQIFITMCMECAYLDNLKSQEHKKRGNMQDESMIATNAVKHIGNHNMVVQMNIKKKYVRNIIQFWIGISRANLLHDIKKKAQRADDADSDSEQESRIANVI